MRSLALLTLVAVALAGCLGATTSPTDSGADLPDEEPGAQGYELPENLSGYRKAGTLDLDGEGAGAWIDQGNDTLYASRLSAGLAVVDIADPQDPKVVSTVEDVYARDVDVMHRNGSTYAILAGGSEGIHVVDVTDPADAKLVTTADEWGAHNVAVVPGTPYVYDATAVGPDGKATDPVIPVLDLSDLDDPAWSTFPIPSMVNGVPTQSDGCHDVVVRVDLGQAFCAGGGSAVTTYGHGGGETFIWDIRDEPTDPEWVGMADHPSIMYHHQAVASHDGDTLLINDEFIAPNCNAAYLGPAGSVKQSTAAVWVFDISDPEDPQMRSYVQADAPTNVPNCGSHFGDLIADRDAATWGWYQGGTLLIDFSDPENTQILDRATGVGSVWDARYHDGHAFANGASIQVLQIE